MGELKSAWEVAQERATKLGKLSAGEKEHQDRQRYRQLGQALAQKWLDSPQHTDITAELSRHEEKGRDVIAKAVIARLAEAIELTAAHNLSSVKRTVEAMANLDPALQPKTEELVQLVQEYGLAEQKVRQELESNCRESLHRLRISGTAVDAINVESDPRWQPAQRQLVEDFAPRLNDLKKALIR